MVTIEEIKQLHAEVPRGTVAESRYPRMTDAELQQYARRTTRRPLLCFAFVAAAPFIGEGICRLLGAW